MNFQEHFYSRLACLPDREVQEFSPGELPETYRSAAVLVPLWPEADGSIKVAFTLRADSLPSHKGQVSFPGGGMIPGDNGPEYTALRETREELGIQPDAVGIMGRLDDAWSRFGFHIVPYVGWLREKPEFNPDDNEVAGVIIADVETLMQPDASCIHEFTVAGVRRKSQAFRWKDGYVWGVTADILLELFLWVRG
jgi:8-oxo-dGTP pyrophosphatase MutT (NUDIX family)